MLAHAGARRAELEVDGERLPVWLEQGQVRVELPFDVDFIKLAELLRQAGYFYAHHPERVDSQGWGTRRDYEGYYPYWVWREGRRGEGERTRTIFACPPEEYTAPEPPGRQSGQPHGREQGRSDTEAARELAPAQPVIGPAAAAEIRRWVPFLRQAMRTEPRAR